MCIRDSLLFKPTTSLVAFVVNDILKEFLERYFASSVYVDGTTESCTRKVCDCRCQSYSDATSSSLYLQHSQCYFQLKIVPSNNKGHTTGVDTRFLSLQPDTSLRLQTTNAELVHRAVYALTFDVAHYA